MFSPPLHAACTSRRRDAVHVRAETDNKPRDDRDYDVHSLYQSFPAQFRRTRRQLDAVVRALRSYVMITATGDPDEDDACEGEGLAFDDDDEADQAPPPPPQLKDEMRSCKMAPQSATQKTPRLVPGMGASDLEARWRADDALLQDLRGLLYKLISSDSRLFPLGSAHTSWHPIIIIVYIY